MLITFYHSSDNFLSVRCELPSSSCKDKANTEEIQAEPLKKFRTMDSYMCLDMLLPDAGTKKRQSPA